MSLRKTMVLLLVTLVLILAGCNKSLTPPTQREQTVNDVRMYFPVEQNLTWIYEGSGNEYADFTRKVIYKEGSKVQLAQDNGGTRLGMVLQVLPESVTINYSQEEFYTDTKLFGETVNRSDVWLKAPLKVGSAWETSKERREVLSINETVKVPSGTYSNVVKIKITHLAATSPSEHLEYYAPQVGLILSQFSTNGSIIESRLKTFKQK